MPNSYFIVNFAQFIFKIKKDCVADAIQLLGMSSKRKKKYIKSHKSNVMKRMMAKKLGSATKSHVKNDGPMKTYLKANDCLTVKKQNSVKTEGLMR